MFIEGERERDDVALAFFGDSWWGGRVIIFSQEFPHLKSSLGAPSLYICSQLLHHGFRSSAVWSDIFRERERPAWHVQVRLHGGSWLPFDFINYKPLSFIQFLSVTVQNTLSSVVPWFFFISITFLSPLLFPLSPFPLIRTANTGCASKNKRL